jgi:hypothetical protein
VEPTDKQFYDYIVGHLKREHGLANSRMTWMLTSQAFLFAAFGVINSKTASLEPDLLHALRVAIPSVGITVSVAPRRHFWEVFPTAYTVAFDKTNVRSLL